MAILIFHNKWYAGIKTDTNAINYQASVIIIDKDSNKSYPLIVFDHLILEYSIIMHQIILSFETYTSWLSNLLKSLLLFKWSTYRNDSLIIEQIGNLSGTYSSIQIQEEVLFLLTLLLILFTQYI